MNIEEFETKMSDAHPMLTHKECTCMLKTQKMKRRVG